MVAEPVLATIQALSYAYDRSAGFIQAQHEKVSNSDITSSVSSLFLWGNPDLPPPHIVESSTFDRLLSNVRDNKWKYLTILSIGIGTCSYGFRMKNANARKLGGRSPQKPQRNKRRAPKLPNGARRDVVLIVGSPTVPLTRIIALDFEKRGLIVYVTILDDKDFRYIESNPITDDMNYLNLRDTNSIELQLSKFQQLLELPVIPFIGADAHTLNLVSVVFAPNMYLPVGPIENLSINTWRSLDERILLIIQLLSQGLVKIIRNQQAKTILVNPSITSSLSMAYHAPETVFHNELKYVFTTLARELAHQSLLVTQVRLGNLQVTSRNVTQARVTNMISSEVRSWDEGTRSLYADNFAKSQHRANPITTSGGKGTNLKELYHTLFDLVYSKKTNPRVVYCGTGARSYDIISSILPATWIDFILK